MLKRNKDANTISKNTVMYILAVFIYKRCILKIIVRRIFFFQHNRGCKGGFS